MEKAVVERVNTVLKAKRVTKKELASKLETSETLLGKKLIGSCRMDLGTVVGVLEVFNDIDANWLLLGRGHMCVDGTDELVGYIDVLKVRTSLGLSQSEFARRVGIDRGQLSLIESGKRRVSNNVYNKIKEYLGEDNLKLAMMGPAAIIGNNSNNNVQNVGSVATDTNSEDIQELKNRIAELETENKKLRMQNYELVNKLLSK